MGIKESSIVGRVCRRVSFFLSYLSFTFVAPLIDKGLRNEIDLFSARDIFPVSDKPSTLASSFEEKYKSLEVSDDHPCPPSHRLS